MHDLQSASLRHPCLYLSVIWLIIQTFFTPSLLEPCHLSIFSNAAVLAEWKSNKLVPALGWRWLQLCCKKEENYSISWQLFSTVVVNGGCSGMSDRRQLSPAFMLPPSYSVNIISEEFHLRLSCFHGPAAIKKMVPWADLRTSTLLGW